ncbi:MAG TPA: SDR family NAD(P)-dependent oxidoreductase, partial [Candidatus Angelobacter sp.]|nr:SDR family NAD(P)-dependent oxidoreductase [Candidatus Angelobacter sp.]
MIDFIEYVVGELKSKRLSKSNAVELVKQFSLRSSTSAIHPLLHSNTSDLSEQRYSSTFTGEEFFLIDHQVVANGREGQKVLPGVAFLEMARAAIQQACSRRSESTFLELRNTVWAQPIVVTSSRQVNIALLANDTDQIDYEIYSEDAGQEMVHCQGQAVWSDQATPAPLKLEQLKKEMVQGELGPRSVYSTCARMGLSYGPSFQSITALHRGSNQVLAHLRLPAVVEKGSGDYILHPSLMDGALQAAVGLIDETSELSNQVRLPFALESLRIMSPCTQEMFAWIRYTPGSQVLDKVVKLDIDLCDESGNVCIQMRGFSSRMLNQEIAGASAQGKPAGCLVATPMWQPDNSKAPSGKGKLEYAEHHVVLCELPKADIKKLKHLLSHSRCLLLDAKEQRDFAHRYCDYALACFEHVQAILQRKPQGKVLIQIVASNRPEQALFAGLSGLLKTAALENPQVIGQLILVPADITAEELCQHLQQELAQNTAIKDSLICHEHGVRQVLRWQEIAPDSQKPPVVFKDQGVYLITGGLGGLGLLFAAEILERASQARVVLTGRSPLDTDKQARLDRLSMHAERVSYRQVDLCDLDQVEHLIASIKNECGQLNGILHCAGMIADNFILKKTSAEFSQVLAPKVAGTCNLDQASCNVELDFFVLFSSIAALGNVGQADYATANCFMDQFAAYRNQQADAKQRHGSTRSINWPLWQAGGMGVAAETQHRLQEITGMAPMQAATGMEMFYRSLALPYSQMLVAEGDHAKLSRALLAMPAAEPQAKQPAAAAAIDAETLEEKTQEYLRRQFSGLLKIPANKIDTRAALEQYGIDSILAMKLTNQLEQTFGSLPKTLFFEYQTIRDLAQYFIANYSTQLNALFATSAIRASETMPPATLPVVTAPTKPISSRRFKRTKNTAPQTAKESESIAIIGLSGRYPEAINIDVYWQNLREGKDCIVEVPKERWDWQKYFNGDRTQTGHHYSKWGGFIAGVDEFDPLFFNISPLEAEIIDPQERLFLQHAWMAVEDAGYTRASLQMPCEQDLPGQVGVYVGVMYSEYQLFGAEAGVRGQRLAISGSVASIANRVSYALNLHGPSMTLDTMCSSSLTAIHLACQDLKQGRTSLAIAGGVNVTVHPSKYLMLSAAQAISSDGHCQSFGEGSDGYIPGEGVGAVILKRLSDAQRDGDHIYGVIRGSALNHGGKTNGYTVPNPQAQATAISRALAESHT